MTLHPKNKLKKLLLEMIVERFSYNLQQQN